MAPGEWNLRLPVSDARLFLAGLEPGWYTTAMLYPRYEVWAENEKREPVSPQALGLTLRQLVGPANVERKPGPRQNARRFRLDPEHVSRDTVG